MKSTTVSEKNGVNSKYLISVNQKLEEEFDKKINPDYPFLSCLMGKQEANAMAVHEKKRSNFALTNPIMRGSLCFGV